MQKRPWLVGFVVASGLSIGAGCLSEPNAGDSGSGSLSADPTVTSSRVTAGFMTRGGVPLRTFTVRLVSTDTCDAPALASFEIDLPSNSNLPPVGDVALRTTPDPLDLPSAYYLTSGTTIASGNVAITAATATRITGSLTAQATINGTATTLTASFGAPLCP